MPLALLPSRTLMRHSWRAWWDNEHQPRGPQWLQVVWTMAFCTALSVVFTLIGFLAYATKLDDWLSLSNWGKWLWRNGVICWTIGFLIHGLFAATGRMIGHARVAALTGWQRTAYYALVPLTGVMVGWPLGYMLLGHPWGSWSGARGAIVWTILISALITLCFQLYWSGREREAAAERRASEAQLRLLQGQMEPHFMFNTLGTVLSLIDTDAPQAKRMLETFIDYLRCSLGKLRNGDSTLGEELRMAETYLSLMRMRMGERLAFTLDVADPTLERAALPPLLLQPLVENAIHHGLECKVEGGTVTVRARREGEQLVIDVADDGLGKCEQPVRRAGFQGNGVALDNVRARLQSRWGSDAALTLVLRPDAGALATLRLPLETPA
jgi:signal transduction histidine kinase